IPLIIGIDAIHGDGMVRGTTIYPAPLGLAATFDDALVEKLAAESAVEIRANGAQWTFAPNIDVARDARWGRVGETFGEDPLLVGRMGVAMVRGLQGVNGGNSNSVLACIKHAIAGSEPINGLNGAPADISEHTLRSVFLPPYFEAIENGAGSLMMAHNELNGVPCHANQWLMEDVFRGEGGFKGFIVSDWSDIERMVAVHHTAANQKEAVYQTVMAGMDMHMHGPGFFEPLLELVHEGRIPESRIDASVRRILRAKMQLGLFEQWNTPLERTRRDTFTEEHQQTALVAARKSIVLLKNENSLLPLDPARFKHILVTGPLANSEAILGDWVFQQPKEHIITPLQGLRQIAPEGCEIVPFDCGESVKSTPPDVIEKAAKAAGQADAVVLVVGDNALRYAAARTSGENDDRSDIELPGDQLALVKAIVGQGKPVVIVLVGGRPIGSEWTMMNAPAVVEAFEPGCKGGQAIAEVLFGKVNPSGKLPITVPRSVGQIQTVYNHVASYNLHTFAIGRSDPLFWFGYGLSYTAFKYENLKVPAQVKPDQSITVTVDVTNTGSRAGDEVVLVYLHDLVSSTTTPEKALKAYKRISLEPGEKKTVTLSIGWNQLSLIDAHMKRVVEPGKFRVMVGNQSALFEVKNL
ncbi:MAG TPA: glycoside hydrolase family 3 N-terminal domain-containing protein, partial [Verrucomicrobiae bacterium]|nr:glycoside hydrolase family 3 N-terminal domain-containing protein [Verrucomicrobiae bacterium]